LGIASGSLLLATVVHDTNERLAHRGGQDRPLEPFAVARSTAREVRGKAPSSLRSRPTGWALVVELGAAYVHGRGVLDHTLLGGVAVAPGAGDVEQPEALLVAPPVGLGRSSVYASRVPCGDWPGYSDPGAGGDPLLSRRRRRPGGEVADREPPRLHLRPEGRFGLRSGCHWTVNSATWPAVKWGGPSSPPTGMKQTAR
jgi:hypothetical protein